MCASHVGSSFIGSTNRSKDGAHAAMVVAQWVGEPAIAYWSTIASGSRAAASFMRPASMAERTAATLSSSRPAAARIAGGASTAMYEKWRSTRGRSSSDHATYADQAMRARPAARMRAASSASPATGVADNTTQSACVAARCCTRGPRPAMATGTGPGVHGMCAAPTASPRSSALVVSNASRSAVNGRSGARPSGASTRLPPTPNPFHTRPGANSASVAIAAAVVTG